MKHKVKEEKLTVLSDATTVAHPRASTARSFFTIAFVRAILSTPSARVTVTQIGKASGIAATAKITATVTVSTKNCLPISHPSTAMAIIAIVLNSAIILPNSSILICKGLFLSSTLLSSLSTFPNSVHSPMAKTKARPLPEVIRDPMNTRLRCSITGIELLPVPVNIFIAEEILCMA